MQRHTAHLLKAACAKQSTSAALMPAPLQLQRAPLATARQASGSDSMASVMSQAATTSAGVPATCARLGRQAAAHVTHRPSSEQRKECQFFWTITAPCLQLVVAVQGETRVLQPCPSAPWRPLPAGPRTCRRSGSTP